MTAASLARPPSPGALIAAAAAVAAVTVLFVLPAEFTIDPTGFGNLTGLDRISTPTEVPLAGLGDIVAVTTRSYDAPFRTDVVEVPVGGPRDTMFRGLEYKVTMEEGAILLYRWSTPVPVFTQFHSHSATVDVLGRATVANYTQETVDGASGVLVAPMTGIHGWFFRNTRLEPTPVRLELAGFYRLEPGILDFQ